MDSRRLIKKKRYGWLLFFTAVNWLAVILLVLFVDPKNLKDILFINSYLPMMILLFGAFFWVMTIIFMSTRRAIMWTMAIILFIYLRIWGMGNILNAILIFGILGSLEIYWWSTTTHKTKIVAE